MVLTAVQGERRAVDLLREHLTVARCGPIAIAVVVDAAPQESLEDIVSTLPSRHNRPPMGTPSVPLR